jgi:hypothetical protein
MEITSSSPSTPRPSASLKRWFNNRRNARVAWLLLRLLLLLSGDDCGNI